MINFTREATNDEIHKTLNLYPEINQLTFPSTVQEHNLDKTCSKILYGLLREYQPTSVLEVGTSWGGSGRIIIQALIANKHPFKYVGFEIEPAMRKSTEDNLIPLAPESVKIYGDITKNLDKIPQELDFAFIDTNWDYPITVWWLKNLFPKIKKGGLIQIHDWSVSHHNGVYVYEGGNFEGIGSLIKLFQQNALPLKKVFAVWDHGEYSSQSIAASFWTKTGEMIFCHECEMPLGKNDTNLMEIKQANGTSHLYCFTCSEKFKQILK